MIAARIATKSMPLQALTLRPFTTMEGRPLGDRIRSARRSAKLTQDDVAKALKVSTKAVGNWERDEDVPGFANAVAFARLCSVSMDYLAGFTDNAAGLPVGKVLVDEEVFERILGANSREEIEDLIGVHFSFHVDPETKMVSSKEDLARREKVRRKLEEIGDP